MPNLPGVYRAELPAGHAGTVSAGARTLIERSLPGELQPGEFAVNRASLEFLRLRFDGDVNPEAGTTTDGLVWRHLRTDSDGFLDLGDAYGAQAGKAVFWASTHVWVEPRKESLVWNPGYPEVITGRLMTEGEFRAFRISGRSLKGQVNSYRLWVNGRLLPATVFSTEQDFQLSLPHPDRNYGPSDTWENFRLRTGWNHLVFQFDTSTRPDRTRFKFGVPERIDAVLTSAGKPSGPARPTAGEPRPYLSEYLVLGPFSAEEKDLGVYVRLSGNANPNHVSMDMAARPNAIVTIEADFVQLRGFEIRHGTQSQQRAQVEITGEGIVVEGNLIRASEFGGIKFVADRNQAAAPIVIRNNWILNPGNVGISGSGSSESLTAGNLDGAAPGRSVAWIEDNTIVNSNWAGFPIGWQAGGVKLMKLTGAVIRYNTIIASNGPGIWLDWEHYGNRIEGNLIARAYGYCIGVEGSPGPNLVANNLCQRLRPGPVWFRAGILSWDSQRTWAVNNTVDGGWNQQKGWQGYVGSKGIDLVQDPTRRNNRWGETTVSDHVYVNNLIVGCRQALQSGRTDLVEANYTDRGTGSQSVGEVGFLGRERGDYRIRTEDSLAARGKETTHTAWVPHDFYGLLRFPDQPHGVGAFRTDPRPQPGQSLLIEVELEDGSMRRFYDVRPQ